jgi:hypothetical protein
MINELTKDLFEEQVGNNTFLSNKHKLFSRMKKLFH